MPQLTTMHSNDNDHEISQLIKDYLITSQIPSISNKYKTTKSGRSLQRAIQEVNNISNQKAHLARHPIRLKIVDEVTQKHLIMKTQRLKFKQDQLVSPKFKHASGQTSTRNEEKSRIISRSGSSKVIQRKMVHSGS